jgi:hypothetical protein
MAMIKKGRRSTGTITESIDKNAHTEYMEPGEIKIPWSNDVVIKDVLNVPLTKEADISVDLDEDDEGEIAVRV